MATSPQERGRWSRRLGSLPVFVAIFGLWALFTAAVVVAVTRII